MYYTTRVIENATGKIKGAGISFSPPHANVLSVIEALAVSFAPTEKVIEADFRTEMRDMRWGLVWKGREISIFVASVPRPTRWED